GSVIFRWSRGGAGFAVAFGDFPAESHFHFNTKPFVVAVANDFADSNPAGRKIQRIDRASVGWEPVPIDLFPVGFKLRKQIFLILTPDIRYGLAERFYDLKILVVHPNLSFEITLILLNFFGANIEGIGRDLVDLFSSDVLQVVFADFVAGEDKGLD